MGKCQVEDIKLNMKFTVSLVAKSTARLGSLAEFTRIPEAVLETPLLLLHTRVRKHSIGNNILKRQLLT